MKSSNEEMSEKRTVNAKEGGAQDDVGTDKGKNGQEKRNSEEAGSSKGDRKDTKNEMDFKMNKPWPPLAAEFTGKPRSYSDTSPRRQILKALTKGDIRSCTSYMHLPHIKFLIHLHDSASSPHLHQSFSRMHLPTLEPDNDVPTVSVIALAEARDKDGADDVIQDDNDAKDIYFPLDDVEDSDGGMEEAIYTWDREYGRTRSLSEPPKLSSLSGDKEEVSPRPRALSLESAERAKKPPARMHFQFKLEELEEEHSNGGEESESPAEETEPELDLDHLAKSSILVLAESGEFENDSRMETELNLKDSDSQDEVLTRWTRYESHPIRKPSFCAELSTIDENLGEGTSAGSGPIETTDAQSKNASVLQLVDEVTKNVMSNENLAVQAGNYIGTEAELEVDDKTFSMNKTSPRFGMRRMTLASTSPVREAHGYATEIEREAFNKISQWKSDFAVKLGDVLSKGIVRKTDEKKQKPVVVNVPKNLSDSELRGLKGNLLSEERRKSSEDDRGKTTVSKDVSPAVVRSRSSDAREPVAQESSASSDIAQDNTQPVDLNKITITKDKITELLQWHDQERERLLREMKKIQVPLESPEEPSTSAQVVLDGTGLESVFCSLQIIMDSIFKETILRLRGSLDSDLMEDKTSNEKEMESGRGSSPTKDKMKEIQHKVKKAEKCSLDSLASQTDDVEELGRFAKQKTPETKKEKHAQMTSKNKQKRVKISSRTWEKPRSTETAHRKETGVKSPSPVHVHTTSFAEHVCHVDTCAGMVENSSPSCECDSASDEMETTESEDEYDETTASDLGEYYESSELLFTNVAGRREVIPGKSSTNDTDVTPTSSNSIPQLKSSSSPLTSGESSISDEGERESLLSEELYEEGNEDGLDLEESDACSEIADLLGVYRAYNAVNDHDSDLPPRPHAPELMTYEEKDMREQIYRQETRLNGYKRIVRSFKTRNKRLKEEQLHLRRQIHELHDRCAKKEARITELKHEIEPAMEGYKKALEDKTNITEMKDPVEPSWESYDGESKKYLKTIIREKEKVIQELVSQHEKTFQELTNKIYKVMSERDELKEENSRLKTISRADEFGRKRKKVRLEKASRDAHLKYEDKDRVNQSIISSLQKKLHETKKRHDEDSRLLRETQRSFEELKTSSSSTMEEKENEILALKASVDAFQNILRRLTEERGETSQKTNRTTQADHDFMKAALKEALEAREDEARRHQQTQAKLKTAKERSEDWAATENMMEKMRKQLEALQNENLKLKSHVQRKEESGQMMVQVGELQTKLAQRECEVKLLKEEMLKQQEKINELLKQLAEHSRERTRAVHDEGSSEGEFSLAERCARQWREETELEQQELDELRGKTTTSPAPTDKKEVLRLRKDINDIKSVFEDFLRTQSRNKNIEQDEFKKKLELKAKKDMENMESFYKQIIETKEKAYDEVLKEKDNMIQILNESKNLGRSDMVSEALEATIENVIERDVSRKMDNLRRSLELMNSKLPPKSDVIHEVISDLLKMNQKAINRLEDCTERAWINVKEDIDELKDFTFKMTDAIEKHFYSTHEQLLNSSMEEVIRYVKNEGNGVRKSFADGMQAHHEELVEEIQNQGKAGMVRYDQLQTTIDAHNRSNMREFHQARRDVLLAAEAVSNSAEELYQIKRTLTQDLSSKDENEDEVSGATVSKPFEAGKTLEQPEEDYLSKECTTSKEVQHKGLSVTGKAAYGREGTSLSTTAELASLEGAMLRDSLAGMTGEGDSRHTYPLFQSPPSRDSDGLSLRERLLQRKKARTAWTSTDGVSPSDPYTAKMAPFWSRDKPSSAK